MLARNTTDVRDHILRTKAYEVRPVCVVRYLRRLDLSAKHEAVYWEIFRRAEYQGWIARVSLATLAHEVHADESTVTRALARLLALGLLRRQNPGRVTGDPMRQAVTLYEIVFPAEMLRELLAAPDRHVARHLEQTGAPPASADPTPEAPTAAAVPAEPVEAPAAADVAVPVSDPMPELRSRYGRLPAIQAALKAKLSDGERERLERHRQSARTGVLVPFDPDPDTRLDSVELAFLRCRAPVAKATAVTPRAVAAVRRDSPLLYAELRAKLTAAVGPERMEARFDEAVWSLTKGTFAKEPCRAKAMHAIIKLVAEQRWTRPNRMPPNFRAARPEACRSA
jgi:predicted transcriptional regulator